MANELCAYGFGTVSDGNYRLIEIDHWTNGTHWIYRDAFYWFISSSEYLYGPTYIKARKAYVHGSSPAGFYEGVDGNPVGAVKLGVC